jgi:hypothetical protein
MQRKAMFTEGADFQCANAAASDDERKRLQGCLPTARMSIARRRIVEE